MAAKQSSTENLFEKCGEQTGFGLARRDVQVSMLSTGAPKSAHAVILQTDPKDIVVMGRIIAPHGIKGWIKLKVFTETADSLVDYPTWWLNTRNGWLAYKVAEVEWRQPGLAARLEGFDDRTAVEALKGLEVGIPRAEFPELDEGEYYWADLVGLEVVNKQDELLGIVEGLIETGANDVLVVCGESFSDSVATDAATKKVERLIPYVESVIVSVDLTSRRIVADWGLDY